MLSVNLSSRFLGPKILLNCSTAFFINYCRQRNMLFNLRFVQLNEMVAVTYVPIKITAAYGPEHAVANRAVYEMIVC